MAYKLHEHKQTCKEKMQINLLVSIFQTTNEMLKNIISFKWKNYTSYLHDIGIQIYNKFVNMGVGIEMSFHEFLL